MRKLDPTHTLYGRGQRLSDAEIVALYAETKDSVLVAMRAGISSTTVLNRVRASGGEVYQRGHGRIHAHIKLKCSQDEICRLYQVEGVSGPVLAERAGCSTSLIYIILKAHGITRRRATDYAYKVAARRRAAAGGT